MAIPFNIERFKSELTNGGARPNQFAVQLTFPNYVATRATAVRKGPFLVTAAELPGQTMGVTPVFYRGRLVKLSGDRDFAPFNFTVINDSNFTIRTALEQWMNGMDDLINKTGRLEPSQYQTDMFVSQLDRNGVILKQYKLIGAFPVEIGPAALDFGSNDQLSTFSASIQYQTFEFSVNTSQQLVDVTVSLNP
jgi:hypothetical protein